jgi:2',3'-cyclic-nucleotide 2'-phosphodiesterase (5'-nucleotidase family)
MAHLRVLLTADLHGRLTREQARRLAEARRDYGALLLDAGDALTAPNVLVWPWDEPILRPMNEAGYAAMTLGNREFFFRRRGLERKTRPARCLVLAANLRSREGRQALQPYGLVESPEGDLVGIIGLAREMIAPGSATEAFSDLRFVPWQEAAQGTAERLRPAVAWLVALSHLGRAADEELARLCPELDLVLGGHSHPSATLVSRVGQTTVVTAPARLRDLPLISSVHPQSPSEFTVETLTP